MNVAVLARIGAAVAQSPQGRRMYMLSDAKAEGVRAEQSVHSAGFCIAEKAKQLAIWACMCTSSRANSHPESRIRQVPLVKVLWNPG